MKTRSGFVSNSSSSSFVIKRADLTEEQINYIVNYRQDAKKLGGYGEPTGNLGRDRGMFGWVDDFWQIENGLFEIKGHTIIDNFDMRSFLKHIGVPDDKIEWGETDW